MNAVKSIWRAVVAKFEPDEPLIVVKTITCVDGTRLVEIARREDGSFRYVEHCKLTERGMTYWKNGVLSGIFPTAEAAETEARQTLCWLRPGGVC